MAARLQGPVFATATPPTWAGATWIGELLLPAGDGVTQGFSDLSVPDAAGYSRARLLVRTPDRLWGMVAVPLREGRIAAEDLERELRHLSESAGHDVPVSPPTLPFTVVLCTRERPESLRVALTSVLAQDYPVMDVVVVDNAPATDATARVVAELADTRVRLVTETRAGLSHARNAGVAASSTPWIAFTDDDVTVDPGWLRGLTLGIARGGENCVCVTGFVPTGELRTQAQAWFDSRIGWNRVFEPRVFRLSEPPADLPLFPFQVGSYGAGANFAARRDAVERLGGFDVHLGAGTPSKGGEDIDFFYRVVIAGAVLAYEPSAVVWHRHRDTEEALISQAVGYGRGFSAWVTKTLLSPRDLARGLRAVLGRGHVDTAPFAAYAAPLTESAPEMPGGVDILAVEHRATLAGPFHYLRSRVGTAWQAARRGLGRR
ncbi:glycosyltransferase family 2 protein [Mobilicoccus pelagius]|uniref:Putative glycosyltransferase n=1 Tax=Mobilicoccus pelagius NBRC 104925 TaxID=1089455 RepID=H5UQU9_9MICO|nr:glycosyltransferase [Mobilicoccus pelagius]GAB48107.1 putative glycosyltransferase [Mobilicoccus pelagius NBRC 104925]